MKWTEAVKKETFIVHCSDREQIEVMFLFFGILKIDNNCLKLPIN